MDPNEYLRKEEEKRSCVKPNLDTLQRELALKKERAKIAKSFILAP